LRPDATFDLRDTFSIRARLAFGAALGVVGSVLAVRLTLELSLGACGVYWLAG